MSWSIALLIVVSGLAAGISGTVTGLGSVFSYPALLAAGIPPAAANVTNTFSLAIGTVAAVPSSRRELAGQWGSARTLGLACMFGSAVGAALVLLTPSGMFERVVPFLVGGASLAILAPRPAVHRVRTWPAVLGVFAVGVYGGYFAAAAGTLVLAVLLATRSGSLLRLNALKNLLTLIADVVAAVAFALFGHIVWLAVPPLVFGLLIGSWLGPAIARLLPERLLRYGIAIAGVGLAVKLGLDAFG